MSERSIDAKLVRVRRKAGYVRKDETNKFQKYKYASAAAVLQKVSAAMAEEGLAISNQIQVLHYQQRNERTKDGVGPSKMMSAVVQLTINVHDAESGENRIFQGVGEGADSGDKAIMKASTAAHKYAYANGLCISWGDDPEADTSVDKAGATPKGRKRPAAKKKAEKPDTAADAPPPPEESAMLVLIDTAVSVKDLDAVREAFKKVGAKPPDSVRKAYAAKKAELEE